MTVYVVKDWGMEDIVGIYDTRELADAIVEKNKRNDLEVIEYKMNKTDRNILREGRSDE